MTGASITPIFNPYIEKAANLDIGWEFSANGVASVYVAKNQDVESLLKDMVNRNSNLISRDVSKPYNYIAHGELSAQIKKNFVLAEEKKAKNSGYDSIVDKAVKTLPWEEHDDEYSVHVRYLSAPEWQKNLLNALVFRDNSVVRRIDVDDKLSHKGYTADSSYQSYYVANEKLGKLIGQHIEDINKQDEIKKQEAFKEDEAKRQEILKTGEKLQRMIAERKKNDNPGKAAEILGLRRKESIILR